MATSGNVTRHTSSPSCATLSGAQLVMPQAGDTESSGRDSPPSDAEMTWDDAVAPDVEHERTEATFARIDSSRGPTLEEREKWKLALRMPLISPTR